jgi:hypothetical protein
VPLGVEVLWQAPVDVTEALLIAVNEAWPVEDEGFCSWADESRPEVLHLSFEVEAPGWDAAFVAARQSVGSLAAAVGLEGEVIELVGNDVHGSWREGLGRFGSSA